MYNYKFLKEYTLSDLFDGTFKMLKFTWKNTLIISGICFFPLSIVTVILMGSYFKSFAGIIENGILTESAEIFQTLGSLSRTFGIIFILGIITTIVSLFVKACIALNTFKAAHGETITLKDLVMTVLKEKYGKLIVQTLLLVLILTGAMIGGIIAVVIVGIVFNLVNKILGGIMIFAGIIAFYCLLIWLGISFNFINEEVIYKDTPVTASFKKSFFLVKGNWWRVFGILILFSLALSFGVSLISSPLIFTMMAPVYSKMFEKLLEGGSFNDFYTSIFSIYTKAPIPLFISSLMGYMISYLISPVFTSLFYLDLKMRKKEIALEPLLPGEETTGTETEETTGTETGGETGEMKDSDQQ